KHAPAAEAVDKPQDRQQSEEASNEDDLPDRVLTTQLLNQGKHNGEHRRREQLVTHCGQVGRRRRIRRDITSVAADCHRKATLPPTGETPPCQAIRRSSLSKDWRVALNVSRTWLFEAALSPSLRKFLPVSI